MADSSDLTIYRRRSARLAASITTSAVTADAGPASRSLVQPQSPTLRSPTIKLPTSTRSSRRTRKKVQFVAEEEAVEQAESNDNMLTEGFDSPLSDLEDEPSTEAQPKTGNAESGLKQSRKGRRKRTQRTVTILEEQSDVTIEAEEDAPTKSRRKSKKRSRNAEPEDDDEFVAEKKPRKKRAPKPEPVYIIPDVEKKETTFRGRLGYACLNTVLRNRRPASESIFCSRTCRLDSLKKNGLDWVKDLGRKNVEDLITMIQWNEDNNIRFLRVSSEMFPFASHKDHGYSLEYCDDLLAQAGALAAKYGHRLTTHPGQYTQLGSPKPGVIESAVRELEYHCELLDRMKVGPDGVMVIHGGGVYEDKATTLKRLKNTIVNVLRPEVRSRLVLENDELCYTAEDLLPLCEELDVPLVFDYHHDSLNPSTTPPSVIIQRANAIWARRGIKPKQHLSEPRPGAVTVMEKRAHSDRCESFPPDLPDDIDLMIEAKDKEQAVLHLYRIYNLHPVIHASLRPPNPNPSKQTNGRKSNKRARAKALKEQAEMNDEIGANGGGILENENTVEEGIEGEVEQDGILYGEDDEEHEPSID
ncbi:hypothetical protein AX16_008936 [Volvariella volvacea WC 439]|nr:hypothetical protein AX16_008936 [Volvariella volvacea WC 439]